MVVWRRPGRRTALANFHASLLQLSLLLVAAIVLAELVWVLESCYGSTKAEIVAVLQRILRTKQLVVQDAETIWKAVRLFEVGSPTRQ